MTGENKQTAGVALAQVVETMRRLRAPGGCPWDREQTFDSIRRYTLEETYEVFDAIERRDWPHLEEELGDLLLQVLFYAQMAADEGLFDIAGVADRLHEKLVRRHPHVFGPDAGEIATEGVLRNWEQLKLAEKAAKLHGSAAAVSLLDEIPRGMPAALEAQKLGSKAAKIGFDWPDLDGLLAKVEEEAEELRQELASPGRDAERVAAEAGDLLFTAVQLARHAGADAEMALRGTNARFRARFAAMELAAAQQGSALHQLGPEVLEGFWAEAKRQETRRP